MQQKLCSILQKIVDLLPGIDTIDSAGAPGNLPALSPPCTGTQVAMTVSGGITFHDTFGNAMCMLIILKNNSNFKIQIKLRPYQNAILMLCVITTHSKLEMNTRTSNPRDHAVHAYGEVSTSRRCYSERSCQF